MGATTRTNFRSMAGGEITPEMYGRIDDVRYQTGLALCRNFVTLPHGPAHDYEQYLRLESEAKTHALLTGRDALYTEEIPLPSFVVGSPEQVPPTFGWRTEDHLHETGII
jgi:hypothetical protein